ncbi:MAG: hypothetical protein WD558_00260, partial [Pseudomonadales bacterium]
VRTEPDAPAGLPMAIPLVILCVLSIVGGLFQIPVDAVFPEARESLHEGAIPIVTLAVPIIGVILAYFMFLDQRIRIAPLVESSVGRALGRFWLSHWAMDWLYDRIFVVPYTFVARINQADVVDTVYNGTATITRRLHHLASLTQTGQLRRYVTMMTVGLILLVAILLGVR